MGVLRAVAIVALCAVALFGITAMVGTFTGIVPVAIWVEGGSASEQCTLWAGLASLLIALPLVGVAQLISTSPWVRRLSLLLGGIALVVAVLGLIVPFFV